MMMMYSIKVVIDFVKTNQGVFNSSVFKGFPIQGFLRISVARTGKIIITNP